MKLSYDIIELHQGPNSTSGVTHGRNCGTWRSYVPLVAIVKLDLAPKNTHELSCNLGQAKWPRPRRKGPSYLLNPNRNMGCDHSWAAGCEVP